MDNPVKNYNAKASPIMADINVIISAMINHKEPSRKKEDRGAGKAKESYLYI
jgi:hypothetical protein